MIIGKGQLAKAFQYFRNSNDIVILASGVSNSNEIRESSFARERAIIEQAISNFSNQHIVYFSSCALVSNTHLQIPYYKHKYEMEKIIKSNFTRYTIFRLPQVFGKYKKHPTLINYLIFKVINDEEIDIWENAHRYIIHIEDVVTLVKSMISDKKVGTFDLANSYRYSMEEIINCIERKISKKTNCKFLQKGDSYLLDLTELNSYIKKKNIPMEDGKNYFCNKLNILHTEENA